MTTILQFFLIGLGPGAIYALAGAGIVLIFRGSGVLNFAHGAQALVAAQVFVWLWQDQGVPLGPAIGATVAFSALLGAVIYVVAMRPLQASPPVVRIIATVGLLALLQQAVVLIFGTNLRRVPSYFPSGSWSPVEGASVGYDRLILLAVAVVLSIALAYVMRRTKLGTVTAAVGENRLAAASLGHSPDTVAIINWALGSALAGLAGILIVPISGLGVTSLTLLVVPAFAAALLGGFSSFLATLAGALFVGIGQSLMTRYVSTPGGGDAFVFLVIIAVTVARGSVIPRRDELASRLPRAGRRGIRPYILVGLVIIAVWSLTTSDSVADTVVTTALYATVALSLVVLTGLAGQISLGQLALAGIGGWVAARASSLWGWPFPVVALLGIIAGTIAGLLFSVPSLRSRGVSLAVATLGLALAVESVIFGNPDLVGGFGGTRVEPPSIFGIELGGTRDPQRYAFFVIVVFALVILALGNLRSGRVGRRLLAIRSNERAAAALGISVAGVKMYAFALAAAVASIGGVLMAFRFDAVVYTQFNVLNSLNLVTLAMIGGIGYLGGAVVAALMVPSGVVSLLTDKVTDLDRYLIMASGAILIVTLIQHPNGVVDTFRIVADSVRRRWRGVGAPKLRTAADIAATPAPAALEVSALTVRFGATTAVDDMSVSVRPGRITGLIGANGAGKTSLIDAVCGFTPAPSGHVLLGDTRLDGRSARARSRAGLGRCFQTVELFDDLLVRENLLVACESLPRRAWLTDIIRRRRTGLPPRVAGIADALGLQPVLDQYPTELSYGDRKLVGVARALAAAPSVLLLDEPAAGLGDEDTAALGRVLRHIADDLGIGVLLVEHDVDLVATVSDEVVVMDFGRRIASGAPSVVLTDPAVISAYLGAAEADTASAAEVIA